MDTAIRDNIVQTHFYLLYKMYARVIVMTYVWFLANVAVPALSAPGDLDVKDKREHQIL